MNLVIKTFSTFAFTTLSLVSLATTPIEGAEGEETKTPVTTFATTRIISGHSTRMLQKKQFDVRITHRFGDMATPGASATLFGLDNSSDIRIGFEYGISDKFNIGFGRSKGAGPQTRLLDGYVKYNIMTQTEEKSVPLSITLLGTSSLTNMKASTDSTSPVSFHDGVLAHRLSYCAQLIVSKKFGERFSLQIAPTYVHRNYVAFEDQNGIFSVGAAVRLKISKTFAVIGEYYYLFPTNRSVNGVTYYNPAAFALEFNTGGHVFHVNFTNSAGIGETQFIPHTYSDLLNGEFRLGFNVSRVFKF